MAKSVLSILKHPPRQQSPPGDVAYPAYQVKYDFERPYGMTGSGKKNERCGSAVYLGCVEGAHHVLDSKDPRYYVEYHPYSCDRPICPVCYKRWAYKRASKAERRYQEYLRIVNRRPSKRYHFWLLHVVISPGPVPLNSKIVNRICKSIGLKGWILIHHPWRKRKGERWRLSPHWHIVGVGWIDPVKQKQMQGRYKVLIKNIKPKEERDFFATLSYQLTHCAVSQGKHTFTWCGQWSYNKFASPVELEKKAVCPHCGSLLVPVIYVGPKGMEKNIPSMDSWRNPDWFIYKDSGKPPPIV